MKNTAASIQARLKNRFKKKFAGEHDFLLVLARYANERFLFRLGESDHREDLVLKGAMLLITEYGLTGRPTRDVDFAGYGNYETGAMLKKMQDICLQPIAEDDGLIFQTDRFKVTPIRVQQQYKGLRFKFLARLGSIRIPMQVDVGFGDVIEPDAVEIKLPTMLNQPAPHVFAYPIEVVISEKFNAMANWTERTTRFKDFFDIYKLAHEHAFDGERIVRAIRATFARQGTPITTQLPQVLNGTFYADSMRDAGWSYYIMHNKVQGAPMNFSTMGETIRTFLTPPWEALAEESPFAYDWDPNRHWTQKSAPSGSAL